ncbi:hypothetical protein E3N88_26285 [Mikania micrantha]|uniref:Uncharacterized protein n=1 Tax=Mikania micrantha TaxID=192012 RepID=A0A5N6N8K8_9ASTR|nr:hypothetical protein E3N88_26285 [Mikania micrantha]
MRSNGGRRGIRCSNGGISCSNGVGYTFDGQRGISCSNGGRRVLTVRSAGVRKPNPKKRGYNSKGKNKAVVAVKHATNKAKPITKAPPP